MVSITVYSAIRRERERERDSFREREGRDGFQSKLRYSCRISERKKGKTLSNASGGEMMMLNDNSQVLLF
jgi:hypothetical protein